jgi:hypothetical protein
LNTPLSFSRENEDNYTEGLTEEEINLVNQIRQSNLSPSEYLQ